VLVADRGRCAPTRSSQATGSVLSTRRISCRSPAFIASRHCARARRPARRVQRGRVRVRPPRRVERRAVQLAPGARAGDVTFALAQIPGVKVVCWRCDRPHRRAMPCECSSAAWPHSRSSRARRSRCSSASCSPPW
jgi:hypothetical protein